MPGVPQQRSAIRFGVFDRNVDTGELRKHGVRLRLQEQPFTVLSALLERPGEMVSREELQRRLWPDETHGGFEEGLSTAVMKIRQALGDSATTPRFVETLPKRGYRFIGSVERLAESDNSSSGWSRWYGAVAAVALVTSLSAMLWLHESGPADVQGLPGAVPLTTYRGEEDHPTFSPDGRRVAFHWRGESGADIYVRLIGEDSRLQLTSHPDHERFPAWSPDGKQIAFLRGNPGVAPKLVLIPSIGGKERELLEPSIDPLLGSEGRFGPKLAWSPDDRWIVTDGRSGLVAVSTETREVRRLTVPPTEAMGDGCPAFSPDGRTLVFCRIDHWTRSNLFRIELGPNLTPISEPIPVTRDERAGFTAPFWLPNGREMLVSTGAWAGSLAMLDVSSGETKVRSLSTEYQVQALAYSDKANRLVYSVLRKDSNLWRLPIRSPGKANGGSTLVTTDTAIDHFPEYAPDGRIAFWSNRTGGAEVWVSQGDGSDSYRVTRLDGAGLTFPEWSPDGRQIMFASAETGNFDLYAVDVDDGTLRQVHDHPAFESRGIWSPDMKTVYFSSNRTGRMECFRVPASGGEPERMTSKGGRNCDVSSDGRFLYYVGADDALWRMFANGGDSEKMTPALTMGSYALAEEGVYFLPKGATTFASEIRYLDLRSRKTTQVVALPAPTGYDLSVTSDGAWLLWSQADQRGADLMLVEDFR